VATGKYITAFAFLLSSAAIAAPGDMSVATFLAKAEKLQAKGMMALMSSDIGVLKAEAGAAGTKYRSMLKSDAANNRPPHSCPPAKATFNSDDLMKHLRTYTIAERQKTTITTATADLMKKRYPCK
jgi:hypothetical protein